MAEGSRTGRKRHEPSVASVPIRNGFSARTGVPHARRRLDAAKAPADNFAMLRCTRRPCSWPLSASLAIASAAAATIGVRQASASAAASGGGSPPTSASPVAGDARARGPERPARTHRRRARPAMAGGHAGGHAALSSRRGGSSVPGHGPTSSSSASSLLAVLGAWYLPWSEAVQADAAGRRHAVLDRVRRRSPSGASRTSRRRRSCTACSSP